jgi:hypothetical protein
MKVLFIISLFISCRQQQSEYIEAASPMPVRNLFWATDTVSLATGNLTATLTVTLRPISDSNISFSYKCIDGTAAAGINYRKKTGTVIIYAGDSIAKISIRIIRQTIFEPPAYFDVKLFNPVNANIQDGIGRVFIYN